MLQYRTGNYFLPGLIFGLFLWLFFFGCGRFFGFFSFLSTKLYSEGIARRKTFRLLFKEKIRENSSEKHQGCAGSADVFALVSSWCSAQTWMCLCALMGTMGLVMSNLNFKNC